MSTPVYLSRADPENEFGGGQLRGLGTEVPQWGPGAEPRADDFSQLKGYLDVLWRDLVTSGILGGMPPP